MTRRRKFPQSKPLACLVVVLSVLVFTGQPVHPLPPATFKKTIRVMTFNIHVGVGMDKKLDLERIADVIKKEQPDLVGLQEVDRGVKRTEGKDEIRELAELTRMDYAFAHNLDFQGGQYGVAILSRTLLKNSEHLMFQNKREAERRGMLRVEVELDGKVINFITTHLDYQYEDSRVFETEQLLRFLEHVQGPAIVVADMNDEPGGDAYKLMATRLSDAWLASHARGPGFTYPADTPVKRIDHIFFSGKDFKARKATLVNTVASDHLPVIAELQLR